MDDPRANPSDRYLNALAKIKKTRRVRRRESNQNRSCYSLTFTAITMRFSKHVTRFSATEVWS